MLPPRSLPTHTHTHTHTSTPDISRLKPIKEQLPETIMYGDINLTIAILAVTTGFVRPQKTSPPKPASLSHTSSSFISPPPFSLSRSASTSGAGYRTSGSGSWSGRGNWKRGQGTKRKLPSSFKSGSHSNYGSKPKAKSKKFW